MWLGSSRKYSGSARDRLLYRHADVDPAMKATSSSLTSVLSVPKLSPVPPKIFTPVRRSSVWPIPCRTRPGRIGRLSRTLRGPDCRPLEPHRKRAISGVSRRPESSRHTLECYLRAVVVARIRQNRTLSGIGAACNKLWEASIFSTNHDVCAIHDPRMRALVVARVE
jgi:hypothetical protein